MNATRISIHIRKYDTPSVRHVFTAHFRISSPFFSPEHMQNIAQKLVINKLCLFRKKKVGIYLENLYLLEYKSIQSKV